MGRKISDLTIDELQEKLAEVDDENEADRRMEEAEEMTVDGLMQLPWEEVDRLVSDDARRELVQFSVEQYYDKALLEVPQKARKVLADSQQELFE